MLRFVRSPRKKEKVMVAAPVRRTPLLSSPLLSSSSSSLLWPRLLSPISGRPSVCLSGDAPVRRCSTMVLI